MNFLIGNSGMKRLENSEDYIRHEFFKNNIFLCIKIQFYIKTKKKNLCEQFSVKLKVT